MFRVYQLGKSMYARVKTLNEAIEMAIEHADLEHVSMEIKKEKGNRTYFVLGITPYKNNRFVG